ncbi:MAG: hypothetical protein JW990_06935 [Thermoleophilia bacterium]|nr:hypothetical protein [Thermoleophilia bacterium]
MRIPSRIDVRVRDAAPAPWFVEHATLAARRKAGESVHQLEIQFEGVAPVTGSGGCYIEIDSRATALLKAHGVLRPSDLVGKLLWLAPQDDTDLTCPFRIVAVLEG